VSFEVFTRSSEVLRGVRVAFIGTTVAVGCDHLLEESQEDGMSAKEWSDGVRAHVNAAQLTRMAPCYSIEISSSTPVGVTAIPS
jgi:hypothetical protein